MLIACRRHRQNWHVGAIYGMSARGVLAGAQKLLMSRGEKGHTLSTRVVGVLQKPEPQEKKKKTRTLASNLKAGVIFTRLLARTGIESSRR